MDYFLSCDWGSTAFRLWLAAPAGAGTVEGAEGLISAGVQSGKGATVIAMSVPRAAGAQAREWAFAAHLDEMIADLQKQTDTPLAGLPVVISGMATSAHGWRELPYAETPFAVDGSDLVFAREQLPDADGAERTVYFVSGLRTDRDVMRGEEIEIVGLFSTPSWRELRSDSLLVLPGTHAKHVLVRDGKVVDYRTHMTGELFEVLCKHSVLRLTTRKPDDAEPRHLKAFGAGVRRVRDEGLSSSLFLVRTNGLFDRYPPDENASFLSGLLIGNELADLVTHYTTGRIVLCAGAFFQPFYAAALEELGAAERTLSVPPATVDILPVLGHAAFLARHA